jgi:hypothetical protein
MEPSFGGQREMNPLAEHPNRLNVSQVHYAFMPSGRNWLRRANEIVNIAQVDDTGFRDRRKTITEWEL